MGFISKFFLEGSATPPRGFFVPSNIMKTECEKVPFLWKVHACPKEVGEVLYADMVYIPFISVNTFLVQILFRPAGASFIFVLNKLL